MLELRRPAYLRHTGGRGGGGGGEREGPFGRDHGVNNITLTSSPLGRSQDPDQPNKAKAGDGRGSLRNKRPPVRFGGALTSGKRTFALEFAGLAVTRARLLPDLENPQIV